MASEKNKEQRIMKIAAFVDEKGIALPFYSKGIVKIFVDSADGWICTQKIPFEINETMSLCEIRQRVTAMVNELADCTIFAAETIKGTFFTIFEGRGINIWKLKGDPSDYLNYIKEQEIKLKEERKKPEPKAVGDERDGIYKIDLAKALSINEAYTSKQILVPFLRKTAFRKLEIICTHLPKWFDKELEALKLAQHTEQLPDGLLVTTVTHQA